MKKQLIKLSVLSSLIFVSLTGIAKNAEQGHSEQGERRGPPPFNKLDLNGDGVISFDEFKRHKIPHGDHQNAFSHIDSDGDSLITEQELKSHKPPERKQSKM